MIIMMIIIIIIVSSSEAKLNCYPAGIIGKLQCASADQQRCTEQGKQPDQVEAG